jgi:hypothetical protein
MFDTLKALFFSIYGCFVITALMGGTMWCLVAYGSMGLIYPASFAAPCIFVLYRRERNQVKAMIKGATDIQIDSEKQQKAIDSYLNIKSVKQIVEERKEERKKHKNST